MASARSEPIATANRLSSFTFPPPPPNVEYGPLRLTPIWGTLRQSGGGPEALQATYGPYVEERIACAQGKIG